MAVFILTPAKIALLSFRLKDMAVFSINTAKIPFVIPNFCEESS